MHAFSGRRCGLGMRYGGTCSPRWKPRLGDTDASNIGTVRPSSFLSTMRCGGPRRSGGLCWSLADCAVCYPGDRRLLTNYTAKHHHDRRRGRKRPGASPLPWLADGAPVNAASRSGMKSSRNHATQAYWRCADPLSCSSSNLGPGNYVGDTSRITHHLEAPNARRISAEVWDAVEALRVKVGATGATHILARASRPQCGHKAIDGADTRSWICIPKAFQANW